LTPPSLSRGDVVLTRFPFTDLTSFSVRPALVVSRGFIAEDVVLAAISSVLREGSSQTDCLVDPRDPEFARTGFRVASVIRVHKLAAVHRSVVARRLGQAGPRLQAEVDRALRQVLGLAG
jgi:mRNA interferase MazF